MKDFDEWNRLKKETHFEKMCKKYHEGDIWWCRIGENIGSEQNGVGADFSRPVLVIKGFNRNICFVVPLTTKIRHNKFNYYLGLIDNKESNIILSQLRLVDTRRFINKISHIKYVQLNLIKKAIQLLIE